MIGVLFGLHRAAQDGLDARDDLVEAERLGDVVVAADGEAGDLVLGVVLGGEEQDRRGVAGGAQPLGDAESVHVGQHHVEDDEVGLLLEHGGDGLGAVPDRAHGEAGEAQAGGQQVADVGLVVDDKNLRSVSHPPSICALAVHFLCVTGARRCARSSALRPGRTRCRGCSRTIPPPRPAAGRDWRRRRRRDGCPPGGGTGN